MIKIRQAALAILACLQLSLPTWAEDAQLRGLAEFKSVTASAIGTSCKLAGCRGLKLNCVQLHVKNEGNAPVTIDGDDATGDEPSSKLQAASLDRIIKKSGCGLDSIDWAVLTVAGFLSFGSAEVMLAERLADPKSLGISFGSDGARRRMETLRIGRRLLMPGDETYGMLCFSGNAVPSLVHVPVTMGQYGTTSGQLDVTVATPSAKLQPIDERPGL